MKQNLLSVGIDIGTTTTQIIFSRLVIDNKASAMSIPELKIIQKDILYRSDIYLTPIQEEQINLSALKEIIDAEYKKSGFLSTDIHTGAIIITGETARKENAQPVLESLSDYAGDFVVSTAGPDLEAVLAGCGAGIAEKSKTISERIVNFDIGGGTTNAAVFFNGDVTDTYALDIGGRLIRLDEQGRIQYISKRIIPLIQELELKLTVGASAQFFELHQLCQRIAEMFLELLALRPLSKCTQALFISQSSPIYPVSTVSFSGGVAEYIYNHQVVTSLTDLGYNDIGPLLGLCIRKVIPTDLVTLIEPHEKIRATVVGTGNHAVKISGSTIVYHEKTLPLKNIPVIEPFSPNESENISALGEKIRQKIVLYPGQAVAIAFKGPKSPHFSDIKNITAQIFTGLEGYNEPIIVILEQDFAKALGQTILTGMPHHQRPVICLDRINVKGGDYLDIGIPVAGIVPVVIKTLLFHT
jgi:ethanolamine utilization protein EutA